MVVITSTIVLAALALIALITGAVMLAPFIRDIVTGESTPVELAENDTIQQILDNPDLSDEEKVKLIMALIEAEEGDWTKDVVNIVAIVAAAYIIIQYVQR